MNCAIFCLLALCAFQIVLADQFKKDLNKLHDETVAEVNFITNVIKPAIKTEVDAAEKKGINTGEFPFNGGHGCLEISYQLYKSFSQKRMQKIDDCLNKADKTKDIEFAKSCCEKNVVGLEQDAKVTHAVAKACVAKCPHSDCTKMTIKEFQDIAFKKN